jgi:hypothetical protein
VPSKKSAPGQRSVHDSVLPFAQDIEGSFWIGGRVDPQECWLALYRIELQEGQLVVAEIRIVPWPRVAVELKGLREGAPVITAIPDGGISARALRRLQIGQALKLGREWLEGHFKVDALRARDPRWFRVTTPASHGITAEMLEAPRRPGRRGRGDLFYAEIVALYVEAVEAGSPHPVQEVRRRLEEERNQPYTEASVRALIHQGRQRGLLTRSPRGVAGGQLTPKAHDVLRKRGKE